MLVRMSTACLGDNVRVVGASGRLSAPLFVLFYSRCVFFLRFHLESEIIAVEAYRQERRAWGLEQTPSCSMQFLARKRAFDFIVRTLLAFLFT